MTSKEQKFDGTMEGSAHKGADISTDAEKMKDLAVEKVKIAKQNFITKVVRKMLKSGKLSHKEMTKSSNISLISSRRSH